MRIPPFPAARSPLLNVLYNFKNPIRHFFNLEQVNFDGAESLEVGDLAWTAPVKFKLFKTEDSQRTIGFPNLLNYYLALRDFWTRDLFFEIPKMSDKKRVSPDLSTGEFSVLSYARNVQQDAFELTKYDKLVILDIKSFYGRIYTHDLGLAPDDIERRVTSLNGGRTNGLLLGSYLSLYLAESFLLKIEADLDEALKAQGIDCHYEYFSDDFYFFCNDADRARVTEVFAKVLDRYELQVNSEKTVVLDFEKYTKDNNLEKLWKKIVRLSMEKDREIGYPLKGLRKKAGHPAFFTQLVYRLSQISELKYKRIFLANFFKTHYFFTLDPSLYVLSRSDLSYICYIYKLMPEAILYSLPTIKQMAGFDPAIFGEFLFSRFKSVLQTERQEEQVYFYYAIKVCGLDAELPRFKDAVLRSGNQILVSYFLLDKLLTEADLPNFSSPREEEWLQNYHALLSGGSRDPSALIPVGAKKEKQKQSYAEFYRRNLEDGIPFVRPIGAVEKEIRTFLAAKIASY